MCDFIDLTLADDDANSIPTDEANGQYETTRSLGGPPGPTSSWRPFGPLDFVLSALHRKMNNMQGLNAQ